MSGPGDDDLDDVTLWAGRLRAWPVAPQVADDGDETVRTPRRGSALPDSAPVDDGDETVRAPRDGAAVPASLPVDEGDGDETEPSSPRAAIAEDMERGGRVESEAVTDDDTAPMRAGRPFVGASGGIVDELTVPSRSIAGAPARPNGTAVPVESPGGASPELGEDAGAAVDDTAAGVRRPRAASPPVVDRRNPPLAREAHEPTALHRDAYAPRVDAPVRVSRNAAAPAPRGADAATVSPRRSRGAARLVLLVAAMAAVVILAAVGLVLLIG